MTDPTEAKTVGAAEHDRRAVVFSECQCNCAIVGRQRIAALEAQVAEARTKAERERGDHQHTLKKFESLCAERDRFHVRASAAEKERDEARALNQRSLHGIADKVREEERAKALEDLVRYAALGADKDGAPCWCIKPGKTHGVTCLNIRTALAALAAPAHGNHDHDANHAHDETAQEAILPPQRSMTPEERAKYDAATAPLYEDACKEAVARARREVASIVETCLVRAQQGADGEVELANALEEIRALASEAPKEARLIDGFPPCVDCGEAPGSCPAGRCRNCDTAWVLRPAQADAKECGRCGYDMAEHAEGCPPEVAHKRMRAMSESERQTDAKACEHSYTERDRDGRYCGKCGAEKPAAPCLHEWDSGKNDSYGKEVRCRKCGKVYGAAAPIPPERQATARRPCPNGGESGAHVFRRDSKSPFSCEGCGIPLDVLKPPQPKAGEARGEARQRSRGREEASAHVEELQARVVAVSDENHALRGHVERLKAELAEAKEDKRIRLEDAFAKLTAAQTEAKRLREALGPDNAGRDFAELLIIAADLLEERGGGPVEDCLRARAEQVRAALEAKP